MFDFWPVEFGDVAGGIVATLDLRRPLVQFCEGVGSQGSGDEGHPMPAADLPLARAAPILAAGSALRVERARDARQLRDIPSGSISASVGKPAGDCFAGGNVGDGPGWWVVVFCAALSTGALFLLWGALQAATDLADSIVIERDGASAVRLAGFLVACGLVLGRSACFFQPFCDPLFEYYDSPFFLTFGFVSNIRLTFRDSFCMY